MVQESRTVVRGQSSNDRSFDPTHSVVCVIGLGYVGFPLAKAFSHYLRTIGYDTSSSRLAMLEEMRVNGLELTPRPADIQQADFILICVPTPVTPAKEPDLSFVRSAADVVGRNMKPGATVVLESTVYPGVTEDVVVPVLEASSGLRCGRDFKVGYSPERINPGDDEHSLEKIRKIVAGMDEETTERLASLYGLVTRPYRARNIRTAEAAKVIENVQRDLNIALMNELAIIFHKMDIDTSDVLAAASTKWNFIPFRPGLVGGHCIPVDPYYLVSKARDLGYQPQVITAGRSINDYMPKYVAEMTIRGLNDAGKVIKGSHILVLGVTYKENVPDIRESPVKELVKELKGYQAKVYGSDPLVSMEDLKRFNVLPYDGREKMDCVIATVGHDKFRRMGLDDMRKSMNSDPVLIDVRGIFDGDTAKRSGFHYHRL